VSDSGSHVKVAVAMSPLAHKLALCSLLFAVVAQTALVGLASAASKSKAGREAEEAVAVVACAKAHQSLGCVGSLHL
jgi:hypothetical protein